MAAWVLDVIYDQIHAQPYWLGKKYESSLKTHPKTAQKVIKRSLFFCFAMESGYGARFPLVSIGKRG
jgi:hypothetical protein